VFTRLCLERSPPSPIYIVIDEFLDPGDTRETAIQCLALVTRMLGAGNLAHMRRCVSLSWSMVILGPKTASFGVVFPRGFEILESLYIEDFFVHEGD
jgi:hypothetical protein